MGGGYAALTTARRMLKRGRDLDVTVVNPHGCMTYQQLPPEVAAGTVQPSTIHRCTRTTVPSPAPLTSRQTSSERRRPEDAAAVSRDLSLTS